MENEIDLLKQGEDWLTRERLSNEICEVLNESAKGEIGLSDFVGKLEKIVNDGKEKLKVAFINQE